VTSKTIPWCLPCDEAHFEKDFPYLTQKEEAKEEKFGLNSSNMKAPPKHYLDPILYSSHQGFLPSILVTLIVLGSLFAKLCGRFRH
jgi:hypothetical protein